SSSVRHGRTDINADVVALAQPAEGSNVVNVLVVDAAHGRPISGAAVRALVHTREAAVSQREAVTDVKGEAVLLLPDQVVVDELRISPPCEWSPIRQWRTDELGVGQSLTVTIALGPGVTIRGTVRTLRTVESDDGSAIAGVRVFARRESDWPPDGIM